MLRALRLANALPRPQCIAGLWVLCLTCLKQIDVVLMGWVGVKVLLNDVCLHRAVQDWGDDLARHLVEAYILLVAPKVPATMFQMFSRADCSRWHPQGNFKGC